MFEPKRSEYDLKFKIMDIPVRVHPFFWVMVIIFGFQGSGQDLLVNIVSWGLAVFISILAHEMGHALVGRFFGSHHVHIVLHGFGGVAVGARGRSKWQDIQISAAGPFMGFFIVIPFVFTLLKAGYIPKWILNWPLLADMVYGFIKATGGPVAIENRFLIQFIFYMVVINIFWGIINLLPVYPLDGGQIMNELVGNNNPFAGPSELVNKISIIVAVAAGVGLLSIGLPFAAILFGYLAYLNYQMMNRRTYF